MKFIIETSLLRKLVRLAAMRMPERRRRDPVLVIGASGASACAEANETFASVETLVLIEGECTVPRNKFEQVLSTFSDRNNLTLTGDENGLTIGRFTMPIVSYSSKPSHPSDRLLFSTEEFKRESEPTYPAEIEWSSFSADLLRKLFSVYGRASEVAFARRMWDRLKKHRS